jgi:hypothetical protein
MPPRRVPGIGHFRGHLNRLLDFPIGHFHLENAIGLGRIRLMSALLGIL